MDIQNIRVSVIIPTYKRSEFLSRAINSVINQTQKNIEIIIVDDNPPDSHYIEQTQEILKVYNDDNRIIYKKNISNLGSALSRNEGAKIASGEYVTFLDDDDIYLPKKVESQLRYMVEDKLDMSFTDLSLYNEQNKLIDYRSFREIRSFKNDYLKKFHLMRHLTGTNTFMFKRDAFIMIDGFDSEDVGDEFYLMYKAISRDLKIGYLDVCDVIAYVHKMEGISKGSQKIIGENKLYNFKRDHFSLFSFRERMFIRFRHNVVLLISHYRGGNLVNSLYYATLAFLASPIDFIKEPIRLQKEIKQLKKKHVNIL